MNRVMIYTRVSTDNQDAENQRMVLLEVAQRLNHPVVGEVSDVESGARHRESLDDLYDMARAGSFDILYIWSLDRLTRQGPMQTLMYLDRFIQAGVRVYSHQQSWLDPSNPFWGTMVAMFSDIAKMERDLISERTKAGLARAKASGKRLGRPPGSKDKGRRNRSGYYARHERSRSAKQ